MLYREENIETKYSNNKSQIRKKNSSAIYLEKKEVGYSRKIL